jgi:hypothetical protein
LDFFSGASKRLTIPASWFPHGRRFRSHRISWGDTSTKEPSRGQQLSAVRAMHKFEFWRGAMWERNYRAKGQGEGVPSSDWPPFASEVVRFFAMKTARPAQHLGSNPDLWPTRGLDRRVDTPSCSKSTRMPVEDPRPGQNGRS